MIQAIALGFGAVFLLSYWFSARVAVRRSSTLAGLLSGVVSLVVLLGAYLTVLALWARAALIEFVNTQLPVLTERIMLLIDQVGALRETF
ncbi:MAG: hypothetical protein AAF665_16565 [Pseudomonadota bacterium]